MEKRPSSAPAVASPMAEGLPNASSEEPFDIDRAMDGIREAIRTYKKAAFVRTR